LMLASNVTATNGIINLNYGQVDLGSIYGIYEKSTDKMIVHIPFAVASKYLRIDWLAHQGTVTNIDTFKNKAAYT
jgi:hypothetical protein